jgi:hypothetical protein
MSMIEQPIAELPDKVQDADGITWEIESSARGHHEGGICAIALTSPNGRFVQYAEPSLEKFWNQYHPIIKISSRVVWRSRSQV